MEKRFSFQLAFQHTVEILALTWLMELVIKKILNSSFQKKKKSLPNWRMTNDYTHCSSDIYDNKIISNTCYNENQQSFNFPFSLENPYGKHHGSDIWGGDVFSPVNTLQK